MTRKSLTQVCLTSFFTFEEILLLNEENLNKDCDSRGLKMELNLYDLHIPKDVASKSWICVSGGGLKEKLHFILNDISEHANIPKTEIFRIIAQRLSCPSSNVKRRIYCRDNFPLIMILALVDIWRTKLNKSEQEFINKKQELHNTFGYLKCNSNLGKPVKAVKSLSVELAKICGAHAADGWMNWRKRENGGIVYEFALREQDKGAVSAFRKWVYNEFSIITYINDRQPGCYSIEFTNKIFVRYLHIFFDFPYGKKSNIVKEPNIIINSDLNIRKAFAFGVMTFDGGVSKNGTIELMTCSKQLRDSIFEIIKEAGIFNATSVSYHDNFKRWRFYSSRSIKNPDYLRWLDFFEKDTHKYQRILNMVNRRRLICSGERI
jgi:hypothetical protein